MTAFYFDVHIAQAITDQLRRRGVDVLTAIEDGLATSVDEEILERARQLRRVVFTHDIGFRVLAENWQRIGRPFAGLLFGRHRVGIGEFVKALELVANASDADEWTNAVDHVPF